MQNNNMLIASFAFRKYKTGKRNEVKGKDKKQR